MCNLIYIHIQFYVITMLPVLYEPSIIIATITSYTYYYSNITTTTTGDTLLSSSSSSSSCCGRIGSIAMSN